MSEAGPVCRWRALGRVPYAQGLDLQRRVHGEVVAGGEDRLLLLEHTPVLTIGRGGGRGNLLVAEDSLARLGIELFETERGGDITYHGPGQLVGYPILDLRRHGRDLHALLRRYEEVGLRVLARLGLTGGRDARHTGVWAGEEKVMAIGVAVKAWVTCHGFALNLEPNLDHFRLIHPCGIRDKGVTSLARLLGRPVSRAEVEPLVVEEFGGVFGLEMVQEV
ncbi:MAG: lipoyl(octanoyl) transferase LipB [Patescibacteria group bacterium]